MKPYGDVTEGETITESIQLEEAEATVFSGSGDDEESDGADELRDTITSFNESNLDANLRNDGGWGTRGASSALLRQSTRKSVRLGEINGIATPSAAEPRFETFAD